METFRVRITKASKQTYWYANRIGEGFEVKECCGDSFKIVSPYGHYIDIADCEIIPTYKPIEYQGKIYTQLKEITGEAIYLAQEDKEMVAEYLDDYEFFEAVELNNDQIEYILNFRSNWLPFLVQHGFIKIEDVEFEYVPVKLGDRCFPSKYEGSEYIVGNIEVKGQWWVGLISTVKGTVWSGAAHTLLNMLTLDEFKTICGRSDWRKVYATLKRR